MGFCSAVTLCFAAICAVVSALLLAIAFSTDNWQVIRVDREKIEVRTSDPSCSKECPVLGVLSAKLHILCQMVSMVLYASLS